MFKRNALSVFEHKLQLVSGKWEVEAFGETDAKLAEYI